MPTLLIRHNLDVMHIVRNVFLNIFYTCMDVKGKTKDNVKARQDLELYCKRPNLELIYEDGKPHKPPASYVLPKDKSIKVCEWVKELRLPDGYASNIAQCVNLDDYNFTGLKSHDCHIFMLRLLPIAFREMLPKAVWDALTELSCYFIYATQPCVSTTWKFLRKISYLRFASLRRYFHLHFLTLWSIYQFT